MRQIKKISWFCGLLCSVSVWGQTVSLQVDLSRTLRDVSQNPVGLNTCWLMNSDAWRPDAARTFKEVVKDAGFGSLRFPYGTLGDYYLWHTGGFSNAVNGLHPAAACAFPEGKDWSKHINPDGSFINDIDFDEFISICRYAGAEPVVMVNVLAYKHGGPSKEDLKQSAVEWVRYANKIRDYHVKYWEIGNEVEGKYKQDMQEYFDLYLEFSKAMKDVDPSIRTGFGAHTSKKWFDAAIQQIPGQIDFLIAHPYMNDFHIYEDYLQHDGSTLLVKRTEDAVDVIRQYASPADRKRIKVLVTEASSFSFKKNWESNDNNILKAMVYFEMLGNMLNMPEVEYVHFWSSQSPWTPFGSKTDDKAVYDDNTLSPMGFVSRIWATSLLNRMVYIDRVAGPVRAYASANISGTALSLLLMNKGPDSVRVHIDLKGFEGRSEGQGHCFSGIDQKPSDISFKWDEIQPVPVNEGAVDIELKPCSVTTVSF